MDPNTEESSAPQKPVRAVVRRHRGPSAVWILPLLAALIAGWLAYKSYRESGVIIDVVFKSAEGLEVNKTRVLYRGLPSGTVRALHLNPDLQSVTAEIEIEPQAEALLRKGTIFWLVKPQISLSGVRGLETLVSGYYIGVQPGHGESTREFNAATEPPPPNRDEAGLYVTLHADSVSSVHRGSPVYYRDIDVGEVQDYKLDANGKQILVDLFIQPQYAHLVHKNSRFWSASGVEVKGKLPDINVHVGSLATIIAGGVNFYNPPTDTSANAEDGDSFKLYADYEAAEDGIQVELIFPGTTQLSVGTEVQSGGVTVGRVRNVQLSDDFKELHASVLIDPRARNMLRAGTRFWLVKPTLSLDQLSLNKLLRGSHIELAPGSGAAQRRFHALDQVPAHPPVYQGQMIELVADQLGSLSRGSPLLYRQLPIGEVTGYELTSDGRQVRVYAVVRDEYRSLISTRSRFWNSSGVRFAAGLDGVKLDTGSLQTLLRGGISLMTPAGSKGKKVDKQTVFHLYPDYNSATDQGRLLSAAGPELRLVLNSKTLGSLAVGSPVLYRQVEVGRISHYSLSHDGNRVNIELQIDPPYRRLITSHSRFWNASGIKASANLQQGVQVHADSLKSLVRGGIAFQTDPGGSAIKNNAHFTLYPSESASQERPLPILIHFAPGAALVPGAPIRYHGQQVGRIDTIHVSSRDGSREARASLFHEARFLARRGTRFWISQAQVRLSGIENPTNLLFGNSVEVLPGDDPHAPVAAEFVANRAAPAYQPEPGLTVELHASSLGSLAVGSPVLYRKVPVGRITGYELTLNGDAVKIYAHIDPQHATLVRTSSRFYNVTGLKASAGLFSGINVKVDSLETLVGGGVEFTTPEPSAKAAKERQVFSLLSMSAMPSQ